MEIVLIGARHLGYPLESVATQPVHVYVCTVPGDYEEMPDRIDPKDMQIKHWGILYASKSEALSGRITGKAMARALSLRVDRASPISPRPSL